MRTSILLMLSICIAANLTPATTNATQTAAPVIAANACGPSGKSYTRTTLYFGLTSRTGGISEQQWQTFLAEKVTPRFPDGLTVWEADGQWRKPDGQIARERSKVLLLVHEPTAAVRVSVAELIGEYKKLFQQESVLWEMSPVCAAF